MNSKLAKFLEQNKFTDRLGKGIRALGDADNPVRKFMSSYANLIAFTVNFVSSIAGANLPLANAVANLAYRSFVFMNGALSAAIGAKQNRGLFSLGHAIDMGVAFTQ